MGKTIVYILEYMQSFVKNEITALEKCGIDVKVVMVSPPEIQSDKGWSYIVGGYESPIQYYESHNKLKKIFRLINNSIYLLLTANIKNIISSFIIAFLGPPSKSLNFYQLRCAVDIYRMIRHLNPHHIHTHFAWGNAFIAMYVSKLLDVPFSVTVHADDIFGLNYLERERLQYLLKNTNKVIAISQFNKDYLVNNNLCLEEKLVVIHCGIFLDRFKFINHYQYNKIFKIITLPSGFVEKKGFDILLDALRKLVEMDKLIECYVVGTDLDGKRLNHYMEASTDLGIENNVKFIGAVSQDKLTELYNQCNMFVLPCVKDKNNKIDGIPVSLMEAMAVGLPVISTKLSGIPELIEHGRNGLLATPNNSDDLVHLIMCLMDDPILSEQLAKSARKKVEQEFNINISAKQMIKLLKLNT